MRIYVAGPYSDEDNERVRQNIARADTAARLLAARGHVPFCPHTMTAGWERDIRFCYEDFLRLGCTWLTHCEGLLLLPGWEHSMGTQREVDWARELGLPIYTKVEDIPNGRF